MTAKVWFLLLRGALVATLATCVIALLGLEKGIWLLLAVAVTVVLLGLGPNYLHPNSDNLSSDQDR